MSVAGGRWWVTPRFSLAVTLVALGLATFFFVEGYPSLIYDSLGYHFLSGVLRQHGLSAWPTDLRTYGYALFLVVVTGFRDAAPEDVRLVVFFVQLALYLAACAWVARRLARVLDSPAVAPIAYAVGALNPVMLLHASEVLTDLLSAVLILLGVALSWRAPGESSKEIAARSAFLSFFCAAAAVAVRPANVVVIGALAVVWVLRVWRWRDLGIGGFAAAMAGLVPPFVPQVIINHRMFGTLNPLIEHDLYRQQASWGMAALKYATLVMPDRSPFLVYTNPLYRGDADPVAFLRHHPLGYLATLALHAFGMLDHDLPFTYVTNLAPWYRWPMAVVNFLLLYLAFVGAVAGIGRLFRKRAMDEASFVAASTLVVAAAYLAIYLPVEVESRFGLALEALTIPLAAVALALLPSWSALSRPLRTALVAGAFVSVLKGVWLSGWVSARRTNPRVDSPANAFVLNPKRSPPAQMPHPAATPPGPR